MKKSNCVKIIQFLVVLIAGLCGNNATNGYATETSLENLPETVSVTSPEAKEIQIREVIPIQFGRFAVQQATGAVTVEARGGSCIASGAVMIRPDCQAGYFEIRGPAHQRILLQVVGGGASDAGATMERFTTYPADGIITLDASGMGNLYVGATLSASRLYKETNVAANYHIEASYLP